MPNVVASFYHDLSSGKVDPPTWTLAGGNWIFVFSLILVPLCFLRRIHSLRHTSYVALFSACKAVGFFGVSCAKMFLLTAYLIIIVIRCYFWPLKGMDPPGEIKLVKFRSDFISTFPVQVFAFTCAQNVSFFLEKISA
jgi:amino acid permease